MPCRLLMFLPFIFTLTGPYLVSDSSSITTTSPASSVMSLTALTFLASSGTLNNFTQPVCKTEEALWSKMDLETFAWMLYNAKLIAFYLEKVSRRYLLRKTARNSFSLIVFTFHFHLLSIICLSSSSTLSSDAYPLVTCRSPTFSAFYFFSTHGILKL